MTPRELIARFHGLNAVVIGDVMVDEYIFGHAERISPEAPVMVIRAESNRRVPGGAANVARNLAALGANVNLIGVVGDDEAGRWLNDALGEFSIGNSLLVAGGRRTTRKTRVIADHSHQVLRIDSEDEASIAEETADDAILRITRLLMAADAVLLSDYLKGTLTGRVVGETIQLAHDHGKVMIANPKPESLSLYRGATLVSLNRAEAAKAAGKAKIGSIEEAAETGKGIRSKLDLDAMLITLGGDGMAVSVESGQFRIPALRVEVADPAGAGDTTIAAVALGVAVAGVAEPAVYETAAHLSAAVVRHVGVAVPSRADLDSIARVGEVF